MKNILIILLLAWSSNSLALLSLSDPIENYVSSDNEFVHLGCGYYFDVWGYINDRLPHQKAEIIPVISDESIRYLVKSTSGDWLIAVEWYTSDLNEEDLTCIIAKGREGTEQSAMTMSVEELPQKIISGRVSVPALKHRHTSGSLL